MKYFHHFLHCVKSVQIRSFSGPYFRVFGLDTAKYGPEKTPYLDTSRFAKSMIIVVSLDIVL